MDNTQFDSDAWITRLAAAIEGDISTSHPPKWPRYPRKPPHVSAEGDRAWSLAQYRDLAERAKSDPVASQQFADSNLRFDSDPVRTKAILREHPVLARAVTGSTKSDGVHVQLANRYSLLHFGNLLPQLAKLSLIQGSVHAASLLHRFLAEGDAGRLTATEIVAIHGLSLDRPIVLSEGAALAPYEDARQRFDLPEDPVERLRNGRIGPGRRHQVTATAALVRSFAWRPGFFASTLDADRAFQTIAYTFPIGHAVESVNALSQGRALLVDLLSVVVGSRLVSHTSFAVAPDWVREMDPNVAYPARDSRARLSDVWPRDTELDEDGAATFAAIAKGWIAYRREDRSIDLAIRRVAASLGPAAGVFGLEDRLLDLGVAMEAMYGPLKVGKIKRQLKSRASRLLAPCEAEPDIAEAAGRFHDIRSRIVHAKELPSRDELESALAETRTLAHDSLIALLSRGGPPDWSRVTANR